MSWYRDVYLKSEDWQNLRAATIALHKGRCFGCGKRHPSVDVHHLQYRQLYDVKIQDLRPLCRSCHKLIHTIIDEKYSMSRPIRRWNLALSTLPCSAIVMSWRRCVGRLIQSRHRHRPPRKYTLEISVTVFKFRRRAIRAERHYSHLLQRIDKELDLLIM